MDNTKHLANFPDTFDSAREKRLRQGWQWKGTNLAQTLFWHGDQAERYEWTAGQSCGTMRFCWHIFQQFWPWHPGQMAVSNIRHEYMYVTYTQQEASWGSVDSCEVTDMLTVSHETLMKHEWFTLKLTAKKSIGIFSVKTFPAYIHRFKYA